ncbi:MAG: DEAD/DEAH box helicase family protein, partial [Puniceicoccales bacterium]
TRASQKIGNQAAHSQRPVRQYDALQSVKELHHAFYWLARTYSPPGTDLSGFAWDDARVPSTAIDKSSKTQKQLEELEAKLEEQNKEALERQKRLDEADAELAALQEQLAMVKAANVDQPDPHDYSEDETRRYLIDIDLRRAGWPLDQPRDREYEVTGMPNSKGVGYVDYVLWGDDGKPLAVVEAKKSTVEPEAGRQQAKLYADCLEQMHGQRPLIFYSNGYKTWFWDDGAYPPRQVAGFYKKEELQRLVLRRDALKPLDSRRIKDEIAGRYYQKRAIGTICASFAEKQRKALLVMATGTGKTRTAIALVDLLQRCNWAKRVLFLADRVSLVNQAANAFKKNLPDSSPVNLVTEKEKEGRVYVCTYPTILNLIDEMKGDEARFGVGHFDLVIIDEAHRSVFQKYKAIFQYFDSLLVGLTATPRQQIDKNTYELFDLENGVPTDAYELEQAVSDGFLVPPKVQQVDLKFPREGIDYDKLSDEEKAEWESLDWGDDADGGLLPTRVNAGAINKWLFNEDTADKVLKHLMENGHKVEEGDRLGKTIIFARNHDHADFIEKRFNHHYPQYAGHFARIIDNQAKYPQSLIDDFSQKDKAPHIAISVDMLDTGIDVPEVLNLVFFKPVYSKIKFWQMIGRGTRLCTDLFTDGQDKADFRIFDFCFNFDFFKENPDGIDSTAGVSLATRLFRARVDLLNHLQRKEEYREFVSLRDSLAKHLHTEVSAMNTGNFIVRMHLEAVERFQDVDIWADLSDGDTELLRSEIATLPSELNTDELEARLFDASALCMQISHIEGDYRGFEADRIKIVEMASALEEKANIPLVKAQLGYLAAIQESGFWQDINLDMLEELRLRLRGLVQFLDKGTRPLVYTQFEDEVKGIRVEEPLAIPKMTGAQYEKKVSEYLRTHMDHIAIQKVRQNVALTPTDLAELQRILIELGEEDGEKLLKGLLDRSDAPSIAYFVRKLVGMDEQAAKKEFADLLGSHSLNRRQIQFIELIIQQLTKHGTIEPSMLYEPPFTDIDHAGPDQVFQGNDAVVESIFTKISELNERLSEL